ncbi:uncharacterized protein BCR38DRAFT_491602 [Pseudomassariella vexata]|uniref:Uncharacterized protein n=1 Tax=Pseudomassariella vexata TaxID=1141098 RepID=A0A1Y2EH78_9PEZI|nr:uncharacterized protein BCR38DRAFT_491602 [Pseudomassariella vexata]ORY70928.1 hypothetical protein BCR38DRAFT_491602 [Pseudomassariella vexata]
MPCPIISAPLAAMTTAFDFPCPTTWLQSATTAPEHIPPFPTAGPSSCNPPAWASNVAGHGLQYYSPAICPRGFNVGPECKITKTRAPEGIPAIRSGETVVYCVPRGYTCTTDTAHGQGGVWGYTSSQGSDSITVGPAIQIRWQSSDLPALETHPLTPGMVLAGRTTTVTRTTTKTRDALNVIGTPVAAGYAVTSTVGIPTTETTAAAAEKAYDSASVIAPPVAQKSTSTSKAVDTTNSPQRPTNLTLAIIALAVTLGLVCVGLFAFVIIRRGKASKNERTRPTMNLQVEMTQDDGKYSASVQNQVEPQDTNMINHVSYDSAPDVEKGGAFKAGKITDLLPPSAPSRTDSSISQFSDSVTSIVVQRDSIMSRVSRLFGAYSPSRKAPQFTLATPPGTSRQSSFADGSGSPNSPESSERDSEYWAGPYGVGLTAPGQGLVVYRNFDEEDEQESPPKSRSRLSRVGMGKYDRRFSGRSNDTFGKLLNM